MIHITLPDGSKRSYENPMTVIDVAKDISEGLARNVISANFNNVVVETRTLLESDGTLILYTWKDPEGKKAFWHSSSHVLAQALEELYPGVKLSIGPAIENGFYYDVDLGNLSISQKDFSAIETKMLEISREKHDFKMKSVSKRDALNKYRKEANPYKIELIENLTDGEITFCDHDGFTDLCRGGHIPNTGLIKAVKLLSVAG
ncbi:MAG: TGS domain-containing protein, partial [Bacteroidota bacterium]|nr:TGS domain-containing protein [Bacteroidota bacterium]